MTSTAPRPPANAGPAGKRLWRAVYSEYELSGADVEVLRQAVVMADELADLEALVRASGPLIRDRDGQPAPNPASQQHRLLSIAQARLMAAIRVTGDISEDVDQSAGRRPQRRSGTRGVYSLRAVE
jgi:hypothetical protein